MGRALARLLAERGDRLFLLGRDPDELERSAARPRAARRRTPARRHRRCDLLEPSRASRRRSTRPSRALGGLDAVVVTAGLFATQDAARSRSGAARPPAHRRFHQHRPVLRAGARARCWRPAAARSVRLQLGGRRARPQAGDPLRRRQGRPLRTISRASTTSSHATGLQRRLVKPGFVKTGMTAGLPSRRRSPASPRRSRAASSARSIAARRSSTPADLALDHAGDPPCCRAS